MVLFIPTIKKLPRDLSLVKGRTSKLPMHTTTCSSMPADQQEGTGLTEAGPAKPRQDQAVTSTTTSHPTTNATAIPNQAPNQTPNPLAPTPTSTSVPHEHGAAGREGSMHTGRAIDIAARAGPVGFSPAPPASGGCNAVETDVRSSGSASSRHVSAACPESREPDAYKPQTADVSPYCFTSIYICLATRLRCSTCCCFGCKIKTWYDSLWKCCHAVHM